jgi:DNA mismatch repair protein MutL
MRMAHSQQLLFPETFELGAHDMHFLNSIAEDLQAVGFSFENQDKDSVQIYGVPSMISASAAIQILSEIIDTMRHSELESVDKLHEFIALTLAKSAAIKSGQMLSQEEMSDMIDRLFACADSNFTPDGKSIHTTLTQNELLSRFS